MTNNKNGIKDHEEKGKLGLLGLGHRSTLFYIDQINHHYTSSQEEGKDDYNTCPFLLLNSNFNDFNPYLPNQFSILEVTLSNYIEQCFSLPINRLIIPNITLHECYDRLLTIKKTKKERGKEQNKEKVIHPVILTIEKLQIEHCQKVVILGSYYTMYSEALQQQFKQAGIDFIIPSKEDAVMIDELRKSIFDHQESSTQLEKFYDLLEKYSKEAAVVIACTEISIALSLVSNKFPSKTPSNTANNERLTTIYDMTDIQIKTALTYQQD